MTTPVNEVMPVKQQVLFDDDALASMNSFADLEAAISDNGIPTADISDLGTGFTVLDDRDKNRLVGVKFAIVDWRFNKGSYGEFVSVMIMTELGQKLIVNDGSTGIYKQMIGLTNKVRKATNGESERAVTMVPKGLTKSDYKVSIYNPKTGVEEEKDATTFYLSLEK